MVKNKAVKFKEGHPDNLLLLYPTRLKGKTLDIIFRMEGHELKVSGPLDDILEDDIRIFLVSAINHFNRKI